jgi:hypothetical protein
MPVVLPDFLQQFIKLIFSRFDRPQNEGAVFHGNVDQRACADIQLPRQGAGNSKCEAVTPFGKSGNHGLHFLVTTVGAFLFIVYYERNATKNR